jgi:hypothetical protein
VPELAKRAAFELPPRNFVVGTALLENPKIYSYYIIGKPSILFLFHNWNCVIPKQKNLLELKNIRAYICTIIQTTGMSPTEQNKPRW